MKIVSLLMLLSFTTIIVSAQNGGSEKSTLKKQTSDLMDEYANILEATGLNVLNEDDAKKVAASFNKNTELQKKKQKLLGDGSSKEIVFKKLPGESSRISLLKEIPVPLTPDQSSKADPNVNDQYAAKVKAAYEQLRAEANRLAGAKSNQQTNEATRKMYEQQLNQNATIAQMGGMEKLAQMSEAERAQAAKAYVAQQTGGYTAEQLKAMTPEQKKAVAAQMVQNNKNAQQHTAPISDEANEIQILEKHAIELSSQIATALQPIAVKVKNMEDLHQQRLNAIQHWVESAEAKLPETEDAGEGAKKEGIENVLFIRDIFLNHAKKDRLLREREIWEDYVNALIPVLQKLDDVIAKFEKRENASDRMKLAIANCKVAGYESIMEANRQAGKISSEAARESGK